MKCKAFVILLISFCSVMPVDQLLIDALLLHEMVRAGMNAPVQVQFVPQPVPDQHLRPQQQEFIQHQRNNQKKQQAKYYKNNKNNNRADRPKHAQTNMRMHCPRERGRGK